jgi:Raf kinase inhibitor-like YbhB/YbcL family protein
VQGVQGPLDASKWFRSVVPDLTASIEEMFVVSDKVILRLRFQGHFTGKFHNDMGKGQVIDFSAVDMYTIKNGRIISNWHLEDMATLMKQFATYKTSKNFKLTSSDIKEGEQINKNQYTNMFGCHGKNERVHLSWIGAPKNTKSFAITFYDKDAPTGSGFWHWNAYNIPANTKSINPNSLPKGSVDANTDIGKAGFFGPCPPKGRTHKYTYTLHALDVETISISKNATSAYVRFNINAHTIDKTNEQLLLLLSNHLFALWNKYQEFLHTLVLARKFE